MRKALQLPDLTFPSVKYGTRQTPWDLRVLLYKGGAAAVSGSVPQLIAEGNFGDPLPRRLKLVKKLHEEIHSRLGGGGSEQTAVNQITTLRHFFAWADRTDSQINFDTVTQCFCAWTDWLLHRTLYSKSSSQDKANSVGQPISMNSAYEYGAVVGALLDSILERRTNIMEMTRLRRRCQRKTAAGVEAEKQNLRDTFEFGQLLQDLCDGLPVKLVLEAPLPIEITLRSGKSWFCSGNKSHTSFLTEQDSRLGDRFSLANLRIEAELLMFIGQTGMNLEQAHNLELRHFFYVSHLDGYQVKDHKARRGGAVLFEIFNEYRSHFERYLAWRRELLAHSTRLFPFIRTRGGMPASRFQGHRIRMICKALEVPYVSPRQLRSTRVNWLLRVSGDPDLTAEMAQHTKKTLAHKYERPSLQRAMVESTRFWAKLDPHVARAQSLAPGCCTGRPQTTAGSPRSAPKPDCTRPSGCLWCENHRDVDSLDHVWALTSFRLLKMIELASARTPIDEKYSPPARLAVDRLNAKLRWFDLSDRTRSGWVVEAQARIDEGDYHPDWRSVLSTY